MFISWKKPVDNVVLWEPDLLPSLTALHPCSSCSKAPEKKGEDGPRIGSTQSSSKDDSSSDGTACMTGTQSKGLSMDSKQAPEGEKLDTDDGDDLPFDLSIDSGSLTCVACGILGYPFMAILQPSRKALEEISLVDKERYKLSCEKEICSNVLPCSPNDGSSGMPLLSLKILCFSSLFINVGNKVNLYDGCRSFFFIRPRYSSSVLFFYVQ